MATKAIHLEHVTGLTSDAFTAALHRFTSRRGRPQDIYCDGGTNFIGTKNDQKEIQDFLQSASHRLAMVQAAAEEGITFHVNPPHSPHHGGLWEAGVKSMKKHLSRVMDNLTLTSEEFQTLLCQTEAVLNSRPLTPMSSDPNDMSVLTPGHFLVGRPLISLPQRNLTDIKPGRLDRWQLVQQLSQHFWKRWSTEYLTLLHARPKWLKPITNLEVGMLVLIRDDDSSFKPNLWKLGRIVQTYPGEDGKVRVCDIKTNVNSKNTTKTILRRPIVKLIPLPFYD